jgi:hypothetical protein
MTSSGFSFTISSVILLESSIHNDVLLQVRHYSCNSPGKNDGVIVMCCHGSLLKSSLLSGFGNSTEYSCYSYKLVRWAIFWVRSGS